jgi:hypothetical protein
VAHLITTIILYLVLLDTVDLGWAMVSPSGRYSCIVLLWDTSGNSEMNALCLKYNKDFWEIENFDEILKKAAEVCSV